MLFQQQALCVLLQKVPVNAIPERSKVLFQIGPICYSRMVQNAVPQWSKCYSTKVVLFHKRPMVFFPKSPSAVQERSRVLFQKGPKYCSKQFLKVLFQKTLKVLSHKGHQSAVPQGPSKCCSRKVPQSVVPEDPESDFLERYSKC